MNNVKKKSGKKFQTCNIKVFGQIITANGIKLGAEFKMNTYTFENQSFPALSPLPNGNFIVVWLSYYPPPFKYNVRGQIFTSVGEKYGLEILISKYALITDDPCFPTTNVLGLSNNAFMTLYYHQYQNDSNFTGQGFYTQFIDYKGDKIKSEFHMEENVQTYQFLKPLVVTIDAQTVLIVLNVLHQDFYSVYGYYYNLNFESTQPALVNNSISIVQGQTIFVTEEMLSSDSDVFFLIISTIIHIFIIIIVVIIINTIRIIY